MSKSKGNVVDPLERDGEVRHRRVPLHAGGAGRPGPRHPHRRRAHRGLPQLRQQALERRAPGAVEPRRLRPRGCAEKTPPALAEALDPEPAAGDHRRRPRRRSTLPVQRRRRRRSTSSSGTSSATGISRSPSCALPRRTSPAERERTQHTLVTVLETTLRLLHPFMPFITEEIWQRLPHEGESIMVAPYPRVARRQRNPEAEREMARS